MSGPSPSPGEFGRRALLSHMLLVTLVAATAAASLWRGLHTYDPFHWGLMLADARRLCEGGVPYRDLWVPYGFLTTVAQGVAFCVAGRSMVSVLGVTVLAWSIGVYLLGRLTAKLTGDTGAAVAAAGLLVLLHPAVEYPWPNYLAFPWLAGGALLLTHERIDESRRVQLMAGMLLGLAVLARDGLWPAVVGTIIGRTLLHHLRPATTRAEARRTGGTLLLGAALPPVLLLGILWMAGLLPYWHAVSVRLTQLYVTEVFPSMSGRFPFAPFVEWLGAGLAGLDPRRALLDTVDPRRTLVVLTLCANAAAILIYLRHGAKPWRHASTIALLAFMLTSAAFHLPELFRLATGSLIGVATLVLAARAWKPLAAVLVMLAGAMWVTVPTLRGGGPLALFPTRETLEHAAEVRDPSLLAGMRWRPERARYYAAIQAAYTALSQTTPCHELRLYNHSFDGVVAALSPFPLLHPSPIGPGGGLPFSLPSFQTLRPERELPVAIAQRNAVAVMRVRGQLVLPADFLPWRVFPMPAAPWFSDGTGWMELTIPIRCRPQAEAGSPPR